MSVIKLLCKICGNDRFNTVTNSADDEYIARIYCVKCQSAVKVDDVVWYSNDYILPGALPTSEHDSFNDGVYLIPGT